METLPFRPFRSYRKNKNFPAENSLQNKKSFFPPSFYPTTTRLKYLIKYNNNDNNNCILLMISFHCWSWWPLLINCCSVQSWYFMVYQRYNTRHQCSASTLKLFGSEICLNFNHSLIFSRVKKCFTLLSRIFWTWKCISLSSYFQS